MGGINMNKQDIDYTKPKIVNRTIQVGAPPHPDGVLISFDVETVATHFRKRLFRGWKTTESKSRKTINYVIGREEFENLIHEWRAEWLDYEAWRMDIIQKHHELYGGGEEE